MPIAVQTIESHRSNNHSVNNKLDKDPLLLLYSYRNLNLLFSSLILYWAYNIIEPQACDTDEACVVFFVIHCTSTDFMLKTHQTIIIF